MRKVAKKNNKYMKSFLDIFCHPELVSGSIRATMVHNKIYNAISEY